MSDDERTTAVNGKQTTRYQATRIKPGDGRVAGVYEQSAEAPGADRAVDLVALLRSLVGVEVAGLVDQPRRLGFSELRSLAAGANLSDIAKRQIDVVDLFTCVQVGVAAEVVMATTVDGRSVAFRVDAMLSDSAMCFEIGTLTAEGPIDWKAPLTLVGREVPGGSLAIHALDFVTFDEFINSGS